MNFKKKISMPCGILAHFPLCKLYSSFCNEAPSRPNRAKQSVPLSAHPPISTYTPSL